MPSVFRLALCIALLFSAASVRGGESRVALVVGNAAYRYSEFLKNPVNDARAIAEVLRQANFDVLVVTNADRGAMVHALGQFSDKLKPDGVAAFYYAGHGMQIRGVNYLVPIDADIQQERDAALLGVSLDDVFAEMENAGTRFNLIILDACRDNPLEVRNRSNRSGGGLAPVEAPRGSLIAFATAPGKTAADGKGANGLYTSELVQTMRQPGLAIEQVLKLTAAGVERASKNKQTPWYHSSFRGDFYLFGAPSDSARVSPAIKSANEALFWASIKDTEDRNELEAYLAQYPNGQFASLAKARLERLKVARARPPAVPPPASPPTTLFSSAKPLVLILDSADGIAKEQFVRNVVDRYRALDGKATIEIKTYFDLDSRGLQESQKSLYEIERLFQKTGIRADHFKYWPYTLDVFGDFRGKIEVSVEPQ